MIEVKAPEEIKNSTSVRQMWTAVLLGVLVATSPSWLSKDAPHSSYDAPWIHPAHVAQTN